MNNKPFTLHIIKSSEPGLEPLKAILPGDGTRGLVIGEDWEVQALYDLLGAYLSTGQHSGEIADYNEQLGTRWLTSGEAAALAEQMGQQIPERTIRWATAHNFITGAEKVGRDWRFPQRTFLHWLRNRPRPGRKQ
jgi:hypothetical protein